jgi:hypothetical protein
MKKTQEKLLINLGDKKVEVIKITIKRINKNNFSYHIKGFAGKKLIEITEYIGNNKLKKILKKFRSLISQMNYNSSDIKNKKSNK